MLFFNLNVCVRYLMKVKTGSSYPDSCSLVGTSTILEGGNVMTQFRKLSCLGHNQ